jgi:hypothetical protein
MFLCTFRLSISSWKIQVAILVGATLVEHLIGNHLDAPREPAAMLLNNTSDTQELVRVCCAVLIDLNATKQTRHHKHAGLANR